MNQIPHFGSPITNEPILLEETLSLPEITFYVERTQKFLLPDDPSLDGAHIHDDYEIYLHLSGNGAFLVDNRLYALRRGDIIFTRPGDVHVYILNDACLADYVCLWLSPVCGKKLLSFSHETGFCPHLTFEEPLNETLIDLLCRLADKDSSPDELEKLSSLLQIAVAVGQKNNRSPHAPLPLPEEMQRIMDYIDTEFCHIASVEELAAHFNISPPTLGRRFRRYIHLSPGEFIKAKRLAYAKKLLDGGIPVTESCMRAGFSDCSYFIAVFKQRFGYTPGQIRKRDR